MDKIRNKDADIRSDVLDELAYEPQVDATAIGVAVEDGVVTLSGYVPTYAQKCVAEKVAQRVKNVRAIVQNIDIRLPGELATDDVELARRASNLLSWNVAAPKDGVKVRVEDGWVTLHGQVPWAYQREHAEAMIRHLKGIKGVTNLIAIVGEPVPSDIRSAIRKALERSADIDASGITVAVDGSKVTLTGRVHNWSQRYAAEHAAWASQGVNQVDDQLSVL